MLSEENKNKIDDFVVATITFTKEAVKNAEYIRTLSETDVFNSGKYLADQIHRYDALFENPDAYTIFELLARITRPNPITKIIKELSSMIDKMDIEDKELQ